MTVAGHCDALIDFISNCKLCIFNVRKCQEMGNYFTSIFGKCLCVPIHLNQIFEKLNLGPLITRNYKLLDNSIIHDTVQLYCYDPLRNIVN